MRINEHPSPSASGSSGCHCGASNDQHADHPEPDEKAAHSDSPPGTIVRYAYHMPATAATPDPIAAVARAVLRLGRRLRSERPGDSVSLSALGVLATLRRRGPLLAVELAALERLKPQSLTRLLAGMERAGLIERQPSALDGRARTIALTASGRATLRRDLEARRDWLAGAIARTLSSGEREQLVRAAQLMLKVSEDAG
jgi:DNA-binding MarR family transcriptional regulator